MLRTDYSQIVLSHTLHFIQKERLFFGKFGVLCFLETPFLRFALLPYYRQGKVMCFARIQLCSQGCVIDFFDTSSTIRNSLRRAKLISLLVLKNLKKIVLLFY